MQEDNYYYYNVVSFFDWLWTLAAIVFGTIACMLGKVFFIFLIILGVVGLYFNVKDTFFKKPILIINNDGIEDLNNKLKIYWREIINIHVEIKKYRKNKTVININFLISIEYNNGNILNRERNMSFLESTTVSKEDLQQKIVYFLKKKRIKLSN